MWVDQEFDWIYNEIWMKGKVDVIPWDKFTKFGAYAGLDLSTTTDLSAYVILSEPDELGDRMQSFICPKDTIEKRQRGPCSISIGPIWVTSSPHQET
jgi:hypothetical protein